MIDKNSIRFTFLLIIVALNLGCDQVSKVVARQNIEFYEQIVVIKDRFVLTKVENTGAFLSAGSNLPEFIRIILLTVLPIVVLMYGLFYLYVNRNLPRLLQVGVCFLIGGGMGNIYDRIVYGSVTDFVHLDLVLFRTGIFNLADVSIMIGIGLMLVQTILAKSAAKSIISSEDLS